MLGQDPSPSPSPKKPKAQRFHNPTVGIQYPYGQSLRFAYDAEWSLVVIVSGRITVGAIESMEFIDMFGIEAFQQIISGK
jgi:hypothetical protein